jgi:hypothetical protein
MKKLNLYNALGFFGLLALLIFNSESCTTHKGMVSCPDLHNASHHQMAMAHKAHHANNSAVAKTNSKQADGATAQKPAVTTPGNMKTEGIAGISTDVPKIKTPGNIYKILTANERVQIKDQISNMLGKKTFLKKLMLGKLDKMDKKYPAPAQSVLHPDGSALTIGEILSIVAIGCVLFFFLGIAALVIGIVALLRTRTDGSRNWARILAILAIVFGALEIVGLILWLLFSFILIHAII